MSLRKYMKYSFKKTKTWLQLQTTEWKKTELFFKTYSTILRTPVTDQFIVRSRYDDIIIPKTTFTELIWERRNKWKNHTAVVCGLTGEEYTFSELKEHSTLVGECLINEGLNSGDVLALMLPNSPQYISVILGASQRGLTICSINSLYTPDEIAYQIKNSGAKQIITYPEKLHDVQKAVNSLKSAKILSSDFKVLCAKVIHKNNIAIPKSVISLNDLVKNLKITKSPTTAPMNISEDSLAFIAHSSGTTGLPKGVCLTHRNVTASILQMSEPPTSVFRETNDDQDVIAIVLPIFQNCVLQIVLCSLYHGSKTITLPKFEGSTFLSVLKQHRATNLFVVPPIILFLGSNPSVTEEHLQSVRSVFTAAAPVGTDDIDRCLKKLPNNVNITNAYGQTESTCCLTLSPYGRNHYKSVGIPVINTEMKVVDIKTGESKRSNKEGEIYYRGPQMSLGYLNNPKATKEAIDDEGWFHTGDIGYYDEDGYFYIVDRIKEMIKVKGFQVAPAELEHILRSCPGIDEAAVIGVPDDRKGEVPIGFIKKKTGSKLTESQIHEFLASRVAPFKLIEKYIFIDSIPTSSSGKILRKELKKKYMTENSTNTNGNTS